MAGIFKWILQLIGWSRFVAEQPEDLRPAAAQFQHQFNTTGITSAVITLIFVVAAAVALYYFWWNKSSSETFKYRYRLRWWTLWLSGTAILVAGSTFGVMRLMMLEQIFRTGAYWTVSLCCALYSIPAFIIGSLFAAKVFAKHTNASCTPF